MSAYALPSGEQYTKLVDCVASFGWALGSTVAGVRAKEATYKRWKHWAQEGREPYAAWCKQFAHDLTVARENIVRVKQAQRASSEE